MNPFESYYLNTEINDILWNKLPKEELFETLTKFNIPKTSRIVSCGCGTGQKEIFASICGYKSILAFDNSPKAIQTAKRLQKWPSLGKVKFRSINVLNAYTYNFSLKGIDLWVDWMCFHNMTTEIHEDYILMMNHIKPKRILIRSFSKTDKEYLEYKKSGGVGDILPPNVPGVPRHFTDIKYIESLFSEIYEIEKSEITPGYDDSTLIDKRVSDKITFLLKLKNN